MLTTRNQRNAQYSAMGSLGQDLLARYGPAVAKKAGRYLASIVNSGRGANTVQPSYSGGAIQSVRVVRAVKKKKSKKKSRRDGTMLSDVSLPRSVTQDRIRVQLKEAIVLSNSSTAGVYNNFFSIANYYASGNDFSVWLPRARTISASFRYFKVRRIHMVYQPSQAYSTTGYYAMGVDPQPSTGGPGSITGVIHHSPSTVGDVKDRHEIIWQPGDDAEELDKLTDNDGGNANAPATICQGTIQFYSANSIAASTAFGLLVYEVDVEFWGLT